MEVTIPATLPVTVGAIMAFVAILSAIIGIYMRLSGQVTLLESKVDKMARRNDRADLETEAVKIEQASQRTTVAVMAEQIGGISRTLERIDRNIDGLLKHKSPPG